MHSPKRRKKYLDGDRNINITAKYRVMKIASTEENRQQLIRASTSHQERAQMASISNRCGSESPIGIPRASLFHEQATQTGNISAFEETEVPMEITRANGLPDKVYQVSIDDEELDAPYTDDNDSIPLQALLEIPGFCDKVTTPVERSPAELLLLVMKYSISNKLPLSSTANLMRLVNSIFATPVAPDSRYMIDKLFNTSDNAEFHATCPRCEMYIGMFGTLDTSEKCTNCNMIIDVSNRSSGNHFAIIDPSEAISEYLHTHENHYYHVMRERRHERGHMQDVYDGKLYRDFVKNLPAPEKQRYVTATFNTDGAPVFESSNYSIWPIFLMINELPVKYRLTNLVLCGLWFGKSKPQMNVFLDPFVDKMNKLSASGIPCIIKGQSINIKFYALICCVDTVARSPMNGTMQFNAFYGCDWCFHPGEWFDGCVRYPVLESICHNRNKENTIKLMKEAVEKGMPVFGIKNASPLINLLHFDIIEGFVPDYLHAYLGVVKQQTEYIIKRLSQANFKILESRLLQIKAPNHIGRLPRPLKDRAMWKAREWENWLLYYSIAALESIIDKKVLKHWSLLVESLHILLKTDISCQELDEADHMLHQYVCGTEEIHSKSAMTYNVHQLLHIAKSVHDWGPLWAHSTFPFESGNHQLLTAIKCARGVNLQILRYMNLQRSVDILEAKLFPHFPYIMKEYWTDFSNSRTIKCFQISNITYFGSANIIDKTLLDMFELSSNTKTFIRIVKNSCLYASSQKENVRSCNSYAQLVDRRYVKIIMFVVDDETNQQLTLCNVIRTTPSEFSNTLQEITNINDEVIAVKTTDIHSVCVFIPVTDMRYICSVANLYKY